MIILISLQMFDFLALNFSIVPALFGFFIYKLHLNSIDFDDLTLKKSFPLKISKISNEFSQKKMIR
jgi:hypothetical protein